MKSAEIKDMSVQDLQERIAAEKAKLSSLRCSTQYHLLRILQLLKSLAEI